MYSFADRFLALDSNSKNPLTTAYILSPLVDVRVESCLHLVYYSVGSMVNKLALYLQTADTFMRLLYSEVIHIHKTWHALHLVVPLGMYRIVIVGERSSHHKTTILVDNISLTDGRCTQECKCNLHYNSKY